MARKRNQTEVPETTQKETTMSEVETVETVEVTVTSTPGETNGDTEKRGRKLEKDLAAFPGKVAITVLGGAKGQMIFDPADLPADIQQKLIPFGLGHKLGDSAAGKSGTDAEEAIEKVWEGIKSGDWTVRAPATPKVSLKDVAANFSNLSEEEKEAAKQLMASLGIKIPGISA